MNITKPTVTIMLTRAREVYMQYGLPSPFKYHAKFRMLEKSGGSVPIAESWYHRGNMYVLPPNSWVIIKDDPNVKIFEQ